MKNMRMIFLLTTVMLFSNCEYDDDILPPVTKIGINSLGCKIDGVPFAVVVNNQDEQGINFFDFLTRRIEAIYFPQKSMFISGIFDNKQSISFHFEYDGALGKYTNIQDAIPGTDSYVQVTRFSDGIVSGYFEMTLKRQGVVVGDSYTIKYTEGRFDIKL